MPSQSVREHLTRRTAPHTYRHRGSLHYSAAQYPSLARILLKHSPAIKVMKGKNPVPILCYSITLESLKQSANTQKHLFCHKLRIEVVAPPVLGRQSRRLLVVTFMCFESAGPFVISCDRVGTLLRRLHLFKSRSSEIQSAFNNGSLPGTRLQQPGLQQPGRCLRLDPRSG